MSLPAPLRRPERATITVALVHGDDGRVHETRCESCGWWPLIPVTITDNQTGDEHRAWWEPLTVSGTGEHTPARCRALRGPLP